MPNIVLEAGVGTFLVSTFLPENWLEKTYVHSLKYVFVGERKTKTINVETSRLIGDCAKFVDAEHHFGGRLLKCWIFGAGPQEHPFASQLNVNYYVETMDERKYVD